MHAWRECPAQSAGKGNSSLFALFFPAICKFTGSVHQVKASRIRNVMLKHLHQETGHHSFGEKRPTQREGPISTSTKQNPLGIFSLSAHAAGRHISFRPTGWLAQIRQKPSNAFTVFSAEDCGRLMLSEAVASNLKFFMKIEINPDPGLGDVHFLPIAHVVSTCRKGRTNCNTSFSTR